MSIIKESLSNNSVWVFVVHFLIFGFSRLDFDIRFIFFLLTYFVRLQIFRNHVYLLFTLFERIHWFFWRFIFFSSLLCCAIEWLLFLFVYDKLVFCCCCLFALLCLDLFCLIFSLPLCSFFFVGRIERQKKRFPAEEVEAKEKKTQNKLYWK